MTAETVVALRGLHRSVGPQPSPAGRAEPSVRLNLSPRVRVLDLTVWFCPRSWGLFARPDERHG